MGAMFVLTKLIVSLSIHFYKSQIKSLRYNPIEVEFSCINTPSLQLDYLINSDLDSIVVLVLTYYQPEKHLPKQCQRSSGPQWSIFLNTLE